MTSRRQLLGSVGGIALGGIAGCLGRGAEVDAGPTTQPPTNTTTNTTATETPSKKTTTDGRFHLGNTTVIEDFEDLSEWSVSNGSLDADDRAFAGSQSMRLTAPKGNEFVWASKSVDWDLTDETLSLAVAIDSPVDNLIVSVRLVAPDTNNVQKMGEFVRARSGQGWMRLDLATRNLSGNPDLSNVTEVQLGMRAADGAIDFRVDDLRTVPRPDSGTVVLSFDDSLESHYTEAFQTLEQYDMPGNVGVITNQVGSDGSLTVDQMTEMRDAGWEFASHSSRDAALTDLSTQEMWLAITDAHDWLANNGFTDGSDSFVYPHGEYDDQILDFVGKTHTMGYRYMDPLSAASGYITDPLTIGRGNAAYDITLDKTMVTYAEMFHTLTVFTFHSIESDEGLSISPSTFEELVSYIDSRDVEVITFSEVGEKLLAE